MSEKRILSRGRHTFVVNVVLKSDGLYSLTVDIENTKPYSDAFCCLHDLTEAKKSNVLKNIERVIDEFWEKQYNDGSRETSLSQRMFDGMSVTKFYGRLDDWDRNRVIFYA